MIELKQREGSAETKRLNEVFHQLWTKAVGTEGYNKEEWQELGKLIIHFGGKV